MYYGTGIGTSLVIIAIGAVLAFAVNLQTTGVNLNAVGGILIVVGLIGLLLSFLAMGDYFDFPWGRRHEPRTPRTYVDDDITPPHTHRREDISDVVYEDESRPRVERIRRVRR
jgi:hypothetical protein